MNRVLRSPAISDKPVVISSKSVGVVAGQADDQTGFQDMDLAEEDQPSSSVGPEDEQAETGDGNESGDEADEAAAESSDEAAPDAAEETGGGAGTEEAHAPGADGPDDVPPDEQLIGAEEVAEKENAGAPEGTSDDTPPEDDEVMIGLEEVAERDAAISASADQIVETEELPASASEIETIVEARLKEFEERFQQEKEDAYHAGFEDGTNEGMKQGLNQSEEEVARFQELVDTLSGQWKDTLRTYDTAVTELAVRIAQKIIDVQIEQDDEAVLQAVHECLAYVEDKTKVIIRVNPDDLEAVRRHRNDWLESLESIDHLLIEAEPTVARGGCVVETPIGDVDAQIEERLERLKIALLEEINRTDDERDA